MHPNLVQDIPRLRQADVLREAEHARLAALVRTTAEERPYRRLRMRRRAVALQTSRPALSS